MAFASWLSDISRFGYRFDFHDRLDGLVDCRKATRKHLHLNGYIGRNFLDLVDLLIEMKVGLAISLFLLLLRLFFCTSPSSRGTSRAQASVTWGMHIDIDAILVRGTDGSQLAVGNSL
jgi:hypothetical protein